jgi:hypothetical protein
LVADEELRGRESRECSQQPRAKPELGLGSRLPPLKEGVVPDLLSAFCAAGQPEMGAGCWVLGAGCCAAGRIASHVADEG